MGSGDDWVETTPMHAAAASGGDEDWVETTPQAVAAPHTSASFAAMKGLQDIPTMGLGDEAGGLIQGALQGYANVLPQGSLRLLGIENYRGGETDPLDAYRHARDENRVESAQAAEEHPVAYYGAGALGALAAAPITPELTAFKGAGVASRFGNAAVNGLVQGGVAGAGDSKADLTRGEILPFLADTAQGAGAGAAFGTAMQGGAEGFNALKGTMREIAELRAAKAMGSELKIQRQEMAKSRAMGLDPLAEERAKGRMALDQGLVKFGDNFENVANRIQPALDAANVPKQAAFDKLDSILSGAPRDVPLSDLDGLQAQSFDQGRLAEARQKLASGQVAPPIRVAREPDGTMTMLDGNNRLTAAREAGAQSIPASVVSSGYHIPSGPRIAERIRDELIAPLQGRPGMSDAVSYLEGMAKNFEDPDLGEMTFRKLNQNKGDFGGAYEQNSSANVNAAKRDINGILKDEELKASASLDPEAGKAVSDANRLQELLIRAKKGAESQLAKRQNNRVFSLSDLMAGGAGMVMAGPMGALPAVAAKQGFSIANKVLRERGAASIAVTLDKLSRLHPEHAIKYVQPLLQAAQRGPQAVAALDYVLAQKDEHWRAAKAQQSPDATAAP